MDKPADHRAVMASRLPAADETDFYPTPPWGARAGGELIRRFDPFGGRCWWEPACGALHMAHGLRDYAPQLVISDAYRYGGGYPLYDFRSEAPPPFSADWVATNPPFLDIEVFIRRAYARATRGVALLMRAALLETVGRYSLLYRDCPLTAFAPFSERLPMHKGRYEDDGSTATFYAWFIWLKPVLRPRRFMARIGDTYYPATVPIPPGTKARLYRPSDAAFAAREAA
jgi:hypothetical protein